MTCRVEKAKITNLGVDFGRKAWLGWIRSMYVDHEVGLGRGRLDAGDLAP